MEKVEDVKTNNLKHKSFLIITKFIPHISAFMYIIYTLFQFAGIDMFILGYLINYSILTWLYFYLVSFVFRYCYIHRLPLYYILINEILTTTDYYLNIPISIINLLLIHILLIGILIFSYTYYYIKNKK
jgi:hypothetical protein